MTTTDGRSQLRRSGREMVMPTQALMLRFRIELQESDPLIWREIEVPGDYTFWDLHVAIQDTMGWLDYHLHRFTMPHLRTKQEPIFGYTLDAPEASARSRCPPSADGQEYAILNSL